MNVDTNNDNPAASLHDQARPYQVIARRYRPRFFAEVVGQEATAETLRHAILKGRLAHAYLFCGPRGVGKTSMARIFARALECSAAQDGNPCDRCDSCDRILRGEDLDVVELDGASNRGIDDVRELIQHVKFAPAAAPYRIFIIDEVHMLTREAFNALLKTLEEPPAHVKFIFATTEPEKVIATVLSRCQRCDFAAISIVDIVRRLEQICESEHATPESGLLERIADLARGGMRDSQSLLDQLLSFAGDAPTLDDLDRITGRLSPTRIRELVDRIDRGERAEVVTELIAIEASGTDPAVVLEQVIEELRSRLHAGVASGWTAVDIDRNLLGLEILQEARIRMKQLGRSDIILELALLRLSTLVELVPLSELQAGGRPPTPSDHVAGERATGNRPQRSDPSEPLSARPVAAASNQPEPAAADRPAPRDEVASDATEMPAPAVAEPDLNTEPDLAMPPSVESGAVAAPTSTDRPAVSATDDDELEPFRQCMSRVSSMFARSVGPRLAVDGDVVRIGITEMGRRFVDRRRVDDYRRQLESEFGRSFQVVVDVVDDNDGDSNTAAGRNSGEHDAIDPEVTPEIVSKAVEIFRGTLR